jgi:hypothetical protein
MAQSRWRRKETKKRSRQNKCSLPAQAFGVLSRDDGRARVRTNASKEI